MIDHSRFVIESGTACQAVFHTDGPRSSSQDLDWTARTYLSFIGAPESDRLP